MENWDNNKQITIFNPKLTTVTVTAAGINWIRTYNHLVRKRTLNHLAKSAPLVECLSVRLQTKWLWI